MKNEITITVKKIMDFIEQSVHSNKCPGMGVYKCGKEKSKEDVICDDCLEEVHLRS
jgi:hypothetical protein